MTETTTFLLWIWGLVMSESEESFDEDPDPSGEDGGLAAFLGRVAEQEEGAGNGEDVDGTRLPSGVDDAGCGDNTLCDPDNDKSLEPPPWSWMLSQRLMLAGGHTYRG